MLSVDSDSVWQRYGATDPYFGVVSEERFRRGRLDERARAEFFRCGLEHVETVRQAIAAHVDPAFRAARANLPDQKPAVKKLLSDPDAFVRLRVALALAYGKDKEAIGVVIDVLPQLSLNLLRS